MGTHSGLRHHLGSSVLVHFVPQPALFNDPPHASFTFILLLPPLPWVHLALCIRVGRGTCLLSWTSAWSTATQVEICLQLDDHSAPVAGALMSHARPRQDKGARMHSRPVEARREKFRQLKIRAKWGQCLFLYTQFHWDTATPLTQAMSPHREHPGQLGPEI